MKKPVLFSITLVLLLASTNLATAETWTQKADMPTATSLHSASVVDGKIYVIGGTDNLYQWTSYWSTVFEYDPRTDTWARKADMPTARARLSTSVVDGKIYAIGGSPHGDAEVAAVEMYDPATDTWTKKADMPRARNWLSTNVVNGKIYVIGGKIYPSEAMVSTVEEYDPTTDTWTRKTDMPGARGMHSASVVDGKIYVIGGVTGSLGPWVSTVEAYDPATDTWTRKADMPTAKTLHSSSALSGKIYVIGGGNSWSFCLSMVEVYDPATDTWSKGLDMPTARGCHSTSVVNGKIYAIGGTLNPSSWMPVSTVEVYDPGLIVPPPDFNGDGLVDIKDLLRLIESWGQDDPAVDIAPAPFGDGIVDALDLELLMSYWGQEIDDPTLITHWALDELEGDVAYDSAGVNDAFVVGGAAWQPNLGQVNGALQLGGVDGCAIAGSVLNPAMGSFSVFAWINGGLPDQVVVSQQGAANWLMVNTEGHLMTDLKATGRSGSPLQSQALITDGNWHRIGFVWDGAYRRLYMDGAEVAHDAEPLSGLESANRSLYIGVGKDYMAGTFFSGLIDDIRIYNRVVYP